MKIRSKLWGRSITHYKTVYFVNWFILIYDSRYLPIERYPVVEGSCIELIYLNLFDWQRAMKPSKNIKPDKTSKYIHLKQIAQMTLGSGNMNLAVELPQGEDLNEWLAVNAIEFYNEISILYGTLTEYCTK